MPEPGDNTATIHSPSRLAAIAACLWLAGCSSVDWLIPKSSELNSLTGYIETMQLLSTGDPATQAEVFQQAQIAARTEPTPFNRLRLALAYAAPAHPSYDPKRAKTLLNELRASPELLTESERQLVAVQLAQVEQVIWLSGENRTLKGGVAQKQRQTRQLASVIDELQKELASAQSKLEAISNLERSIFLSNGLPDSGTKSAGN